MHALWDEVEDEELTRYVCTACGREVLTEDRAQKKFCTNSECGGEARPIEWPPNKQRDKIANLIGQQLTDQNKGVDARSFAQQAVNDEDPLPHIDQMVQQYGGMIGMWLGRSGVEYLRGADENEMDAMLDSLFETAPAHAYVFWQFKPWYYRFCAKTRDTLLRHVA